MSPTTSVSTINAISPVLDASFFEHTLFLSPRRVKPCVATAESIELKPDPIPLSREQESERVERARKRERERERREGESV